MAREKILPLALAGDVKLAGGKAAAMARLIKAGFDIPDGFVVTSAAKIVDKKLEAAVLAAFDGLGAKKVAVRSSAAAEDGAKDAWAGQLDTYLSVTREELLEKINKCLGSADSDRAQAYAKQKQIKPGAVAVIVQKMVPAQASGVAFSVHPVTNDKNQMVIEAVGGLGEKLVSGAVTPNTYIIDKKSLKITGRHLLTQPIINDEQLKNLSETIIKIEQLFGYPVDVEWAIADGQLFILQSRPVTTLG